SLLVLASLSAHAGNWPSWRGPDGNSVSSEKNLAVEWGQKKNIAWRTEIPGWGSSTPAIWGDRIFLTTVTEKGEMLFLAYDKAGKELWRKSMGRGNKVVRGGEGNSACISPVTDGKHVWAKVTTGVLACYDFAGKEIWKTEMQKRYGRYKIGFVVSSTPVLDGDRLYLHALHDGESYVVALNKNTGQEVWYTKRTSDAKAECKHGYTSPLLYRNGADAWLISHGSDDTIAYDLNNGKEIWRCRGLQTNPYHRTLRFISSPGLAPGLIVAPSAKNQKWHAIDPKGAKGDITDSKHIVWTQSSDTPDVACPLVAEGYVYISREKAGVILCIDAKTGDVKYKERIHPGLYRGSPIYADGYVYFICRDGTISVVKAGPKFEWVATNKIQGEPMTASPAVSDGVIYL
ncbi:MAG: PQQ-binding-like beta-propeller repeat protein, partial [Verrucomicrobiota bacterium]